MPTVKCTNCGETKHISPEQYSKWKTWWHSECSPYGKQFMKVVD